MSRRRGRSLVVLAALLLALVLPLPTAAGPPVAFGRVSVGPSAIQSSIAADAQPRNVVLVGWDGADRRRVQEALTRGDLPHLASLAADGAFLPIDIRGATETCPGWAQVLTGYDPTVTGVRANNECGPIPPSLTIFERLKAQFGPDGISTGMILASKSWHLGTAGPKQIPLKPGEKITNKYDREIIRNGIRYRLTAGDPYYNARDSIDIYETGFEDTAAMANRAVEIIDQHRDRPFFFFVHILSPDHWGHRFGEDSKEYYNALKTSDRATGRIVGRLKELDLYGVTAVYVTADHGFDPGTKSHKNAPHVFLATNDPTVARGGDRADIAPTILERMGVDLSLLEPPLSGIPLTRPVE